MKQQLTLFFLLLNIALKAQVFPVQVTPVVVPPYSVVLSEYGNAFRDQVIVNLLLGDVLANRDVRLEFSLTSNTGINAQSTPVIVGEIPFRLSGGTPLRLTSADLQPYFQLENLVGISPQQYASPLPDGLYNFCFRVIDQSSGQPISRNSCAQAFIRQNDPPFLNYPEKGISITETNPTNIVFNWTPRHLNATNVQYEFTLTELWDEGIDPQTAFFTSPPLYETTTNATTLLYGISEPALLPNKSYAWRVRAVVNDGISQTSTFKNNGFSEIWHFKHNGLCRAPQFGLTVPKTATSQIVRWQYGEYAGYKIQYRKVGGSSTAWFEESAASYEEAVTIYNLEKSTTYEYRIGGQCRAGEDFVYGNSQQFTTASSSEDAGGYQCGALPDVTITNQEPLERLGINETFFAGDFPVTAKFVEQVSTGVYTGVGYVTVPYLADTRILVKFENIAINTDKQLTNGIVETTYDPDWKGVDDISDELAALGLGKSIVRLFKKQGEVLEELKREEDTEKKTVKLGNYNVLLVTTSTKLSQYEEENNDFLTEKEKEQIDEMKGQGDIASTELTEKEVNDYKSVSTQNAKDFGEIYEKVEERKDEAFVLDAYALIKKDSIFEGTLKQLQRIADYIKKTEALCKEKGFKSYKGSGIVPECLWSDISLQPSEYYTVVDIAFSGGFVDGLYQEVEGLVLLPKYLGKISEGIDNLTYAYTWAFWDCRSTRVKANNERIKALLDKLEKEAKEKGLWSWVKKQWNDYDGELEEANAEKDKCVQSTQLRVEINKFFEFISEWDNVKESIAVIKSKVNEHLTHISDQDNIGRYQVGKAVVSVGSLFVGIGALTKFKKVKAIIDKLEKFTTGQWKGFADKVAVKVKGLVKGVDDIPSLIAKWDNLTVTEAKSLYSKLSKTDALGSKTVVSQSEILAEINASSSLVNPYNFAHSIDDIVLSKEALFVRVHNSWNPNRPWLVAVEDFQKFTSQDDMIKKLALPILDNSGNIVKPAQISIVKVPAGTKVRKSVARPQDWPGQGHQPGGSIQFEIRDNPAIPQSWFKPMGNVSDYLN